MTFSGKLGGQNDDLIIALQLALLGMRRFLNNPLYASFRKVSDVAYGPSLDASGSDASRGQDRAGGSHSTAARPSFASRSNFFAA